MGRPARGSGPTSKRDSPRRGRMPVALLPPNACRCLVQLNSSKTGCLGRRLTFSHLRTHRAPWRLVVTSSRGRGCSLHYEPLESREMMAVTATLYGGVLTVSG